MPRCCAVGAAANTIPSPPTPAPAPSPSRGRAARSRGTVRSCSAKKPPDELERGEGTGSPQLAGALSSRGVLLRSGAALFALGFVDAGYSGDWSRIGAISKDTEELIKLGAYVVVPLCLALVFSVSKDGGGKS